MHKQQSGFSHILILFLLLSATAVGFAGWRVMNSESKQSSNSTPATTSQLTEAHIEFGIDTLKQVADNKNQANHIISPTNISIALSMLYAGSDGETQASIQQGLRIGDMTIDDVNTQTQTLMESLQQETDQELSIANALWTLNGFEPNQAYSDAMRQFYSSTVDAGDVGKINNWASENTNGKIPTIINSVPSSLRMIITSALYFNGTWKTEFDEGDTQPREFTNRSGDTQDIDTMYLSEDMDYVTYEGLQAVSLPYGEDEEYRMLIVLPDDMDSFISDFDSAQYRELIGSVEEKEGVLYLPKFKEKLSYDLKDSLASLGMGKIFEDRNELTAIGAGLSVAFVQHDVFMDLSESGTEAAAVTSIGMVTTSVGSVDEDDMPFIMDVNRPFLISLYQSSTGEPLFMGVMNNPGL